MEVVVVGAGRVGTAVAVLLRQAGHEVVAACGREATRARVAAFLPGVPVLEPTEAVALGDLVLVGTPDDAIGEAIATFAPALRSGQWVAHLSGALGLDVLAPVLAAKSRRLAIHPLQTFPDVEGALAALPGCGVAVTADDEEGRVLGASLARDLGAAPFPLEDAMRPLYHAAAVFASNDVVAVSGIAERLFAAAGVPDPVAAMAPLQRATIDNVGRLGPGSALTGPAVRGDAGTVERNLRALGERAPEAVEAYVVLAAAAVDLGVRAGRLAPERADAVREVLARWR
ncbi:MAG: Rossmann-like and DUF2520 domain-containing protein [Planctomycetaceae bacterium]